MAEIERLQKVVKKIVDDRLKDLDRLIRLSKQYYNLLDPTQFPTDSKIPFPLAFAMVEEMIPDAVEYLFPETSVIRLEPEEAIDIESLKNAEWALHQTVKRRVPVKQHSSMAIMDSFKVGVGYTITESMTYTPVASGITTVQSGASTTSQRTMRIGAEKKGISYRHLNAGQVLGHIDGSDTNGPKRSSTVVFLDFYTRLQVESMRAQLGDRRDGTLIEAYGKFRAEEKDNVHESISQWNDKIKALNGPHFELSDDKDSLPALIPVVKIYEERRETWLAFGEQLCYEDDGGFSTLRCPITKWASTIDGDLWYGMSLAEAMEKPHLAKNIWINMIYDAFVWTINRPMVYSKEEFPNGPPPYSPRKPIGATGTAADLNNAVKWLDGPNVTQDSYELGNRLDGMNEQITGRKDMAARNYTRGGANAFQELLASTTGRKRMAGWILQTGALQPVYENILIELQMMGEDLTFNYRAFDDEGNDTINTRTITLGDLRRAYSVTLSLADKYASGSLGYGERLQIYQAGKDDPYFEPKALREFLINNEDWAHRLLLPPKQIKQVATEERNATLLNRSLGIGGRLQSQGPQAQQGNTVTA